MSEFGITFASVETSTMQTGYVYNSLEEARAAASKALELCSTKAGRVSEDEMSVLLNTPVDGLCDPDEAHSGTLYANVEQIDSGSEEWGIVDGKPKLLDDDDDDDA